jgi:hypothetical protein
MSFYVPPVGRWLKNEGAIPDGTATFVERFGVVVL